MAGIAPKILWKIFKISSAKFCTFDIKECVNNGFESLKMRGVDQKQENKIGKYFDATKCLF